MDLGLAGRTAAVAAGSAGLGFASAQALANEGVRVVICSRDEQRVIDAAARIGHGCVGVVADVSTVKGAQAFVSQAKGLLGHIDILIANGGGPPPGSFASTDVEAYVGANERSMLATIAMTKAVAADMQQRKWGRIVAITSTSVRQPIANLILSNTARAGLTAFLKTVATEVAPDGVTVNSVQPGSHATDRIKQIYGDSLEGASDGIPTGALGVPADFGSVVAFMCSEQAKFVTGTHLQVDGGAYGGLI
jgi:3-oxoacyl-[acyl-carrier protein] reductase